MRVGNFYLLKKYGDYKLFWLANFFSGLAIWIQNTAAGTYAAYLTPSAFLISLIQVCLALPIFIFSIPAGIISDKTNGYWPLIFIQLGMSFIAIILSLLITFNIINIYLLLFLTFITGSFYAFRLSIGQAHITKTVPTFEIKSCAILNNFSLSVARCSGPFLAGILYILFSPSLPFVFSFLLFFYSANLFYSLARKQHINDIENITKKKITFYQTVKLLKKNILYVYMLWGSGIFFCLSSGFWALLPYLAHHHLKMPKTGLGYLMAAAGAGAITTGFILPLLKNIFCDYKLLVAMFIVNGLSQYCIVLSNNLLWVLFFSSIFGLSWSAAASLLNGEMQTCSELEYRGRALSIYFLVMYFGIVLGSLSLGLVSDTRSVEFSLQLSGCCVLLFTFIFYILSCFNEKLKVNLHPPQ